MDNKKPNNQLIGKTTTDTLENLNSVITLLRHLNLASCLDEQSEYGLFILHNLIQDSLEYEIKRISE